MISHDSNDPKFIARRLVLAAVVVLIGALATAWPVIYAAINDQLYPPIPQPAYATRLENHSRGCWDVLNIRHDENARAVILTLMELCRPKPELYEEFLFDDLTDLVLSEQRVQPETFFTTEWIKVGRDDEVVISSFTICDATGASISIRTAYCSSSLSGGRVITKLERRNWWIADFNTEYPTK